MITSFDLFGTLVEVPRPSDPAVAVQTELNARGIPVPEDWSDAFTEYHLDLPEGAELSLPEHTMAALASRDIHPRDHVPSGALETATQAVLTAFDPGSVTTRDGATAAVDAAAEYDKVAVLSNCTVPGLVSLTLERSTLDEERFDVVVSSVECGWRKPDPRAFAAVTARLDGSFDELVHVGDDPDTDGGAANIGAKSILVPETSLTDLPTVLEEL